MSTDVAIRGRLDELPPKVAAPLHDLMRTGQLRPRTVETVLDAGELAGEPQHLLGFAIGMLDMGRHGVPIKDTVRMARELDHRLNLRWSPRRWQEEHDKLSRQMTLMRLKAENESYDLERYKEHLPERWPGYLIRTSMRLGLEGHRQDHCVSAYHDRIRRGHCAIAVVFVDRKRWTVQLRWTGREGAPVQITQIHGRRNSRPTSRQRRAVYERLGMTPPKRPVPGTATGWDPENTRARPFSSNLQRLLPVLRQHNVQQVQVRFAGGGDSGQIESIGLFPEGAENAPVLCELRERQYVNGRWIAQGGIQEVIVTEAIEAITDDYLEHTNVNWWDNDGGDGYLEINVAAGTVELVVRTNMVNTEFQAITHIETGEDVDHV